MLFFIFSYFSISCLSSVCVFLFNSEILAASIIDALSLRDQSDICLIAENILPENRGQVQTSCFCRTELKSGI